MSYKFRYKHWVPKAPVKKDFPFTYKLAASTEEEYLNSEQQVEIEVNVKVNSGELKKEIHRKLVSTFNYAKYLNKYSEHFLNFEDYFIRISRYTLDGSSKKATKEIVETLYLKTSSIASQYTFNLVPTIKDLKELLNTKISIMSFDTETTGLNPEEDEIVGISLSFNKGEGYYIPIAHSSEFKEFNLGIEAVELVYEALTKAELVFMFNARFDMRMLEYTKASYFLDTSKIKYNDAQLNAHLADSGIKQFNLKYMERHFLGYERPDLKDTLSAARLKTFNFKYIHPNLGLFYAATDGLVTLELGLETFKYFKEAGISGEIDQKLVHTLMRCENFAIRVDYDFAREELDRITTRLNELNTEIANSIGNVNLNSGKQREELLRSFNLDTGEKTKSGAMATGMPVIQAMLERMKEEGKTYPKWLDLLDERAKLEKLNNTFFGRIVEQAVDTQRLRINYRLGVTATGRLSSGKFTGGE